MFAGKADGYVAITFMALSLPLVPMRRFAASKDQANESRVQEVRRHLVYHMPSPGCHSLDEGEVGFAQRAELCGGQVRRRSGEAFSAVDTCSPKAANAF